ncbi:MAG: hypothetical protein H7144_15935 [Burkholderiales bacterium]|nr:hypothetical protein [Phycisphaerae bacterium]
MDAVDVARVLNAAKQKYVIVGAHAVNSYSGKPRATIDVDVVAQHPNKARDALLAAFTDLEATEFPVVIRLVRNGAEAIDIIRPTSGKLFREALKHITILKIGKVTVNVPCVEVVIAMKFYSMITLTRQQGDRFQDAADFTRVIKNHKKLKIELLKQFAELAYLGGSVEIEEMVADIRAGKPISI